MPQHKKSLLPVKGAAIAFTFAFALAGCSTNKSYSAPTTLPCIVIKSYCIEPSADLRGANLSSANLSGLDLSGADLTFANLSGSDLTNSILTMANLSSANLENVDLSNAMLMGTNLSSAVIRYATIMNTDFSMADLRNADLLGAHGTGVKDMGAKYHQTRMPDGKLYGNSK